MCLEWNQQGGCIIICHYSYSKGISIRQEDYHILNDPESELLTVLHLQMLK